MQEMICVVKLRLKTKTKITFSLSKTFVFKTKQVPFFPEKPSFFLTVHVFFQKCFFYLVILRAAQRANICLTLVLFPV